MSRFERNFFIFFCENIYLPLANAVVVVVEYMFFQGVAAAGDVDKKR